MSYTRVLHALGSHPPAAVMPVELARYLSLSRRQPLQPLVPSTPLKPAQRYSHPTDFPPKTGLHSPHHSSSSSSSSVLPSSSEPRSCFRRDSGGGNKKRRVVFADALGLALTAVRLFIPEPSAAAPALLMKPTVVKLQGQEPASSKLERHRFRPGFPQPMQDLKNFLARLREKHVQLGSCSITDHSLRGKVWVSHDSSEKAVNIKVTFDSWRSHHDIPCTFLQQQRFGSSDMSVFTFDLSLPQSIDPKERIEFCVYLRPGAGTTAHWDDNRGQNYRLCVEKDAPNTNQGDLNRFYPTLSKHRPPTWPSREQTSADLQHLHRTLSGRVREEWKTLVFS
ncbi:unnamed protein product [Pleuronectes platessa]|uniref:CBM21 domain-containing protein n=1 Tax=Pleuronectes platessa TaxID=8262 RepID=A0A9N7TN20_PLEPL|nr:unnamed protein product [Pleuronectes platessa]